MGLLRSRTDHRRVRTPSELARLAGHRLETLEPRVLLAAYTFEPLGDALGLPGIIHEVSPPEGVETAGFGAAAVGLGDIDGDGIGDFAVSAPGDLNEGIAGQVFLYSGADGSVIRALSNGFAGFGRSLAAVGDIDADGVMDLMVGSPLTGDDPMMSPRGTVEIYSGADGRPLRLFLGPTLGGEFGHTVALLGDVTGDGVAEVLVGAPGAGGGGEGAVYIITTADLGDGLPAEAFIRTLTGEATGDRFGQAVIVSAGEGGPNVLVGAPGNDAAGVDAGRTYLFAAADGALLLTLTGEAAGDRFGTALARVETAPAGHVFLVGAPGHDFFSGDEVGTFEDGGRVYRFASDGTLSEPGGAIWGEAGARLGEAIIPVGDVNGDGRGDVALIAPGAALGKRVQINTVGGAGGVGGAAIFSATVRPDLGSVAFGIGDIDDDGVADVLVAMPETGAAAQAISSFTLSPREQITGASPDGRFLFYSAVGAINYAYIDGVYTPQGDIPGVLASDLILLVSNQGVIVGRTVEISDEGFLVERAPFIVVGGERALLSVAVTEVIGGPTPVWERMIPVAIAESGAIVFNEREFPFSAPSPNDRAWLYQDGVLTLLWSGVARDMNGAGMILGVRFDGQTATTVLRDGAGNVTEVAGVLPDYAAALDGAGRIYGAGAGLELVRWESGVVTTLAAPGASPLGALPFTTIFDVSDDGRILARTVTLAGRSTITTDYLFTPEDGVRKVSDLVYGTGGRSVSIGTPLRFADDGRVITSTAVLTPVDETVVWSFAEGSPVSAAGTAVLGVSPLGDPILLVRTGDRWTGTLVPTGFIGEQPNAELVITDVVLMREAATGRYIAAVVGGGQVFLSRFDAGGEVLGQFILANQSAATAIVANATSFTTADGRLILAGTDAAGDLVIYFQNEVPSASNPNVAWVYDNLTRTHLEARGTEFAAVASNLTGFSTPWGTDHIGYLDALGQVRVVWWAPGDPLWREDRISSAGEGVVLFGRLTSFVTPWNTLHFNAADGDGNIVAVWWAPGFEGQWRADVLTAPGGPRLDPASLTAFITPWSAMHIMGRDAETGEVTALWWAPATQEWRLEALDIAGLPENLTLTGEMAGSVTDGGTLNVFAAADDGRIARLFWSLGDGSVWTFEDVTAGTSLSIA